MEDDRAYHYAVFAVYRAPGGAGERLSGGARITLVPRPPAEVPAAPAPDGGARWPGPARLGPAAARRGPAPADPRRDRRASSRATASRPSRWPPGAAPGSSRPPPAAPRPEPAGRRVVLLHPVVVVAGEATVGHPARYSCVADPVRPPRRPRRGGGERRAGPPPLALEPAGGRVARGRPRGSPARRRRRPRRPRLPRLRRRVRPARLLAITLPTVAPDGSSPDRRPLAPGGLRRGGGRRARRCSRPGSTPRARTALPGPNPEVTVAYTWRKPGLVGRNWSLTFHTDPPAAAIPPTALVAHPRTVPLSADDGAIVARFPAAVDGATFTVPATVADLARGRARVFADPTADPEGLPPIRFRHPDGTTRV